MSTTRALIVDDSRSARHVLGRMLESFGLQVDAVASAELALTYLQTARPDVIFMDHLMPGMDGFDAIRVIKANPDTATIPVLMYTSQEGDLYLSQARALGAMGVLPKTLKHADVAEALEHLKLHKPVIAAPRPANVNGRGVATVAAHDEQVSNLREIVSPAVQVATELGDAPLTMQVERHEATALSMPQLAHRIAAEVHAELQRDQPPDSAVRWRLCAVLTGIAALLLLLVVIYQQRQIQQQLQQLQAAPRLSAERASKPVVLSVAPLATPAIDTAAAASSAVSVAVNAGVEVEAVPYGEVPLSGPRLERLRALVDKLHQQAFKGVIRVEVFVGDFCLAGNPVAGYQPAADELLANRCDVIGNPFGDGLTVQQRQSVAFANLVASINSNSAGGIKVQLLDGARKPLTAYPAPSATLTAAAWNRVAEHNQRVEFITSASP